MAKDGELLQGQRYDEQTGTIARFSEQMRPHENAAAENLGQARTDITPIDGKESKVRIWSVPTDLDSLVLEYPSTVSFNLPRVLTAIAIVYSKGSGAGENNRDIGLGAWEGSSGGMSLNPTASASGSASIVPDIQPEITDYWSQNVPSRNLLFYMTGNSTSAAVIAQIRVLLTKTVASIVAGVVTTSAIHGLVVDQPFTFRTLVGGAGGIAVDTTYYVKTVPSTVTFTYAATAGGAALNGHSATSGTMAPTVSEWPQFRPQEHTITLKGMQVSLQVSAEASLQYRWSAEAASYFISPAGGSEMEGYSEDVATNVRSVRLPPTIHGLITLSGSTSDTAVVAVEATANIPGITGTGDAPSFSTVTSSISDSATATGSVTPTSLAATPGTTAIPTNGLYLYDVQAQPFRSTYNQVRAILVNFNVFA